MKANKPLIIIFLILASIVFSMVYLVPKFKKRNYNFSEADMKGGLEMVEINYGKTIDSVAQIFKISPAYLKSLCMLECSGRKAFTERFEPHVFERLKQVKFGQLNNYEHVTKDMLADANEDALKNLASSWGPFQLMGYKCLLLDIKVRDIRGDDAIFYGVKWIDMTYGQFLKNKKFKDAFHIHNTGRPYPLLGKPGTHDPKYCERGLKYMDYFSKNLDSQTN
jgi:hypothetical protein